MRISLLPIAALCALLISFGPARAQNSYALEFVGTLSFPSDPLGCFDADTTGGSDVWGWTAPDSTDYAIMGVLDGVAVVRAPDMTLIDVIPGPNGSDCFYHRDIKTYRNYAYVTAEMGGTNEGVMILDLKLLPDSVRFVGSYSNGADVTSHNLSIDTRNGFAYINKSNVSGFRVVDLADLENPVDVNSVDTGDIHDVFAQDDIVYVAEGYLGSYSIWDLTDKGAPVMMARGSPPNAGYAHNIWASRDGRYAMTTEETIGRTVKIWDLQNLDTRVEEVPVRRAESEHFLLEWVEREVAGRESDPVTGPARRPELPKAYSLSRNFPDPFNPSTTIRFDIPGSAGDRVPVRLEVFNVRGQRVRTLVDRESVPGSYAVHWGGRDDRGEGMGSGVYLYRVVAGGYSALRKMAVIR